MSVVAEKTSEPVIIEDISGWSLWACHLSLEQCIALWILFEIVPNEGQFRGIRVFACIDDDQQHRLAFRGSFELPCGGARELLGGRNSTNIKKKSQQTNTPYRTNIVLIPYYHAS